MMTKRYSNKDLMILAVEEHLKCREYPKVGAVIAKDGILLAAGHRGERESIHAERVAIEKLSDDDLIDSTLYTTLEPCVALHDNQQTPSCSELIIEKGISEVYIGVLDPNGTVYSQGYKRLIENDISVKFFNRKLRAAVEEETFEYGDIHTIIGASKRRVPVANGGTEIDILFSEKDKRSIKIKWATLQFNHGIVDLSSQKGAIRLASGASKFSDITDPMVFRFPSHFARMKVKDIAVVKPVKATFCVLIQLLEIYENDILFHCEIRNVE